MSEIFEFINTGHEMIVYLLCTFPFSKLINGIIELLNNDNRMLTKMLLLPNLSLFNVSRNIRMPRQTLLFMLSYVTAMKLSQCFPIHQ